MLNKKHILTIVSRIHKKADEFIELKLKEHGINDLLLPHGSILGVLFKNEKCMKMSEITEKVKKTKSTVTELIHKMENNGYVTKEACPIDSRVIYVDVTDKALAIKSVFMNISKEMVDTFFKDFSEEEINIYMKLSEKILNNF